MIAIPLIALTMNKDEWFKYWVSFGLPLQFLVANVLIDSLLGNLVKISLNILNPLSGAGLPLSIHLGIICRSLLANLFLPCHSPLLICLSSSISGQFGVGVEQVVSLAVVERVVLLFVVGSAVSLGLPHCRLDLVGVDNSWDVGVGDLMVGKVPSFLLVGCCWAPWKLTQSDDKSSNATSGPTGGGWIWKHGRPRLLIFSDSLLGPFGFLCAAEKPMETQDQHQI